MSPPAKGLGGSPDLLRKRVRGRSPIGAGLLALGLLLTSPGTEAQGEAGSRFSLGLALGQPVAISGRMYRGDKPFWDLNVGFAFGPGSRLWGDLLFPLRSIQVSSGAASIQLYAGLGALLGVSTKPCGLAWGFYGCTTDPYVGGRGAVGVDVVFRRSDLVIGLELGPGFGVGEGKFGPILDLFLSARLLL